MSRWTILAILFVARAALGFQFQTVGSVSEQLAADLGLNFTQVGTLIGLFMLPGLILSLPAGYVGRFAGDRTLVCFGLACLAVGGALVAVSHSFALAALGRLICGTGFVFGTIFFTKMVTDWFSGKEIATAMGILVMSWPLGIAVGQITHGWLARLLGWQAAFHAASALCLVGFALLSFYRAPANLQSKVTTGGSKLSRRELLLVSVAAMAWAAPNAAYIVYLSFAPHLLTQGGLGPIQAAATASLASWAMIASIPLCGHLADRSGRPDLVLYTCLCGGMIALLLLPHGILSAVLCLAVGLIGMAPAGIIMSLPGAALRPENRAFGMGIFFSLYFVILAPAPMLAGWLYDASRNASWPIYLAAALIAATAIANLTFRLIQSRKAPVRLAI